MRTGDYALLWHSSAGPKHTGAVAIMRCVRTAYNDANALKPEHPYHDERLDPNNEKDVSKWSSVDMALVRPLKRTLLLSELKQYSSTSLKGMVLFAQSRLSVQPVNPAHWKFIIQLEQSTKEDGSAQPPPPPPPQAPESTVPAASTASTASTASAATATEK